MRREVFGDTLQRAHQRGEIDETVTPRTLALLLRHGAHPFAAEPPTMSLPEALGRAARGVLDGDKLVLDGTKLPTT